MVNGDSVPGIFPIVKQVIGDGVVQFELSLLYQLHDEHRAELLADRGEPKPGIRGVGDVPFPVGKSEGLLVDDLALVSHQYRSGEQARFGRGLTQLLQVDDLVRAYLPVSFRERRVFLLRFTKTGGKQHGNREAEECRG